MHSTLDLDVLAVSKSTHGLCGCTIRNMYLQPSNDSAFTKSKWNDCPPRGAPNSVFNVNILQDVSTNSRDSKQVTVIIYWIDQW